MMEGFGVNTFRMVNAAGKSKLVKFHWRPKLGTFSLIWDEAVVHHGARSRLPSPRSVERDPERRLSRVRTVGAGVDEKQADKLDFDVLDATKLIPEEVVPLRPLGKMILNRNAGQFLRGDGAGRVLSGAISCRASTSAKIRCCRGGCFLISIRNCRGWEPELPEIPINAPKCRWRICSATGRCRWRSPRGQVAYEPSTLEPGTRASATNGFTSFPAEEAGQKVRLRSETFADHYSQARRFTGR